jgi:hypothetical protein
MNFIRSYLLKREFKPLFSALKFYKKATKRRNRLMKRLKKEEVKNVSKNIR